jgi:hypothetical protein
MFSPTSSQQDAIALIPQGTLCVANLGVRAIKNSKSTGAQYLDVELTVLSGEYQGRKIFDMIMDPFDANASDGGRKMGLLALTRICEAIGIFNPTDEASYTRYNNPGTTIQNVIGDVEGRKVAVRVKVEKGTDGYADKNKVGEWLTPNPNSGSGFKGWNELVNGHQPTTRATAFAAPAAAAPASGAPSWLNKP